MDLVQLLLAKLKLLVALLAGAVMPGCDLILAIVEITSVLDGRFLQ